MRIPEYISSKSVFAFDNYIEFRHAFNTCLGMSVDIDSQVYIEH